MPQDPSQNAEEGKSAPDFSPNGLSNGMDRAKHDENLRLQMLLNKRDQKLSWRAKARKFLDEPRSSVQARLFAIAMTTAILFSVITFCLSTVPAYDNDFYHVYWDKFELIFNTTFTIEFAVRIIIAKSMQSLITDVYLYFDAFAVMPYWVELAFKSTNPQMNFSYLDMVKALRMLRLMKLARQYDESIVLAKAITASYAALGVPLFFLFMAMCLFASIIYFAEKMEIGGHSEGPDASAYESIPMAIWFMAVTMTTVGYGDISPSSTAGRFVTAIAMVFGVLFLSMPLAIVGNNFCEIWAEKESVIFLEKLREVFEMSSETHGESAMSHVQEIFTTIDEDKSGTLDFQEFKGAIDKMELKLAPTDLRKLWAVLDNDGSGYITIEEFFTLVLGEHYVIPGIKESVDMGQMDPAQAKALQERTTTEEQGETGAPKKVDKNGNYPSTNEMMDSKLTKQLLHNQKEIMMELTNLCNHMQHLSGEMKNLNHRIKKMERGNAAGGGAPSNAVTDSYAGLHQGIHPGTPMDSLPGYGPSGGSMNMKQMSSKQVHPRLVTNQGQGRGGRLKAESRPGPPPGRVKTSESRQGAPPGRGSPRTGSDPGRGQPGGWSAGGWTS